LAARSVGATGSGRRASAGTGGGSEGFPSRARFASAAFAALAGATDSFGNLAFGLTDGSDFLPDDFAFPLGGCMGAVDFAFVLDLVTDFSFVLGLGNFGDGGGTARGTDFAFVVAGGGLDVASELTLRTKTGARFGAAIGFGAGTLGRRSLPCVETLG